MKTHLKFLSLTTAAQVRIEKRLLRKGLPHPKLQSEFQKTRENTREVGRAVHVARAFLAGKNLMDVELPYRPKNQGHVSTKGMSRSQPNWEMVEGLVVFHGLYLFGNLQELQQKFAEFKAPAIEGPVSVAA